ncbi:hypothetical protein [Humibacter sp.]|uniref:hypothetical protein n=1 Tax=Humibacter sp. TaxID=1940291 RepID=UPI003F7E6C6A
MTAPATVVPPQPETRNESDRTAPRRGWLRALPVLSALVTVLIGALLPLLRVANFYYWDDSAAVAMPVWQRIGSAVLSGQAPFLYLDMWRGGNLIAEAATGMWNPVMVALMVITHPIDDVGLAIGIAKIALFLIMAGGVYLLARSYRAKPWLAAIAGAVIPLSGWALFMNGTAWINETAINAFLPWAWWALRWAVRKRGRGWSIPLAAVMGYLTFSVGDPYGLLALAFVFAAVGIEVLIRRSYRDLWWLLSLGVGMVLLAVVVFLPFVFTASVGVRVDSGIWNDEFLSPNLSDLFGLSAPTFKPYIHAFGLPNLTFPGLYLAWFVLPILPWLRWRPIGGWRPFAGILVFTGVYLLLVLGPSQLGMFRWPARLIPFLYLGLMIILVMLMSSGLRRDRPRLRGAISGAIILLGAWLAYSDMPYLWKWHALTAVLIAVFLWLYLRWGNLQARGYVILALTSLAMLGAQVIITPGNGNVADYDFPRSRSAMVEDFAKYKGLTVQIADFMAMPKNLTPDKAWTSMLGGSLYSVAGVESTNAYTGIGYNKMDNTLCMSYNGGTCSKAWDALWHKEPDGHTLADLMNAQTVVVERNFTNDHKVPAGWSVQSRNKWVTVYHRNAPLAHPNGRVSAADGVTVTSDVDSGNMHESVGVRASSNGGTLTFARLAWPGYSANLNGKSVPVKTGPAGLVVVDLPPGESGKLALTFTPPGLYAGLVAAGAGIVLIVVITVLRTRRREKAQAL